MRQERAGPWAAGRGAPGGGGPCLCRRLQRCRPAGGVAVWRNGWDVLTDVLSLAVSLFPGCRACGGPTSRHRCQELPGPPEAAGSLTSGTQVGCSPENAMRRLSGLLTLPSHSLAISSFPQHISQHLPNTCEYKQKQETTSVLGTVLSWEFKSDGYTRKYYEATRGL